MWALLHLIVRQCGRLGNSFQSSWVLGLPMSPATCFSAHLQSFPCKSADLGSCRVLNRRVPRPVGQVAGPHQFCWTKSRGGLQAHRLVERQSTRCRAVAATTTPADGKKEPEPRFSEKASKQLSRAIFALRRYGWLGFWAQLSLSLTSAVVLIFSVAFTAEAGPKISMYMTLFSTIASLVGTFRNFGLVRMSRKMRSYLEAPPGVSVKKITKEQVVNSLSQIMVIAIVGLGAAVLGLQASVGILLAKTLTNTTANPFLSGGSGAWNPVLAFDVFLLQASTNNILSHFIGLFFALWMIIRIRDRSLWEVAFG